MAHPTRHGTLTANVVATETLLSQSGKVVVAYRGSSAAVIWYTLDGSTPVAEADGSYFVSDALPAAEHSSVQQAVTVKLLSTTAAPYSVLPF